MDTHFVQDVFQAAADVVRKDKRDWSVQELEALLDRILANKRKLEEKLMRVEFLNNKAKLLSALTEFASTRQPVRINLASKQWKAGPPALR